LNRAALLHPSFDGLVTNLLRLILLPVPA
jgi:hypothetical protein